MADAPDTNDSPPASADDQAPSNSDQTPPSNDDTPPSSPDTPPSSPDSPGGGGRLRQLCEDACEVLEALSECPDSMGETMGGEICDNDGCAAAVEPSEPIPCLDQIEGLFGCITRLPNVCMQEQAAQCVDEVDSFSECADENPPIDEPNPTEDCTPAGGCNACQDDCAECYCDNAALGAGAIEFCTDACVMNNR